jgi:hypothetical protein
MDKTLIQKLVELSCTGPVDPSKGEGANNPYPGTMAQAVRDEEHSNILAWAATSVLKNLAIEPFGREALEYGLPRFCYLGGSTDLLEYDKAEGVLLHMHRADPCWFQYKNKSDQAAGEYDGLCIDMNFLDIDGYNCGDYEGTTKEECQQTGVLTQGEDVGTVRMKASEACCCCGGGKSQLSSHDEL